MPDVHTKDVRRKNMQAIKGVNTKPEIRVRKLLFKKGFRYRIAPSNLPSRPDIYFPKYHAAVLINGCFWHGHNCDLFKIPETRKDFWVEKISGNIARDLRKIRELIGLGIQVLVVWECAISGKNRLSDDLLSHQIALWLTDESISPLAILNTQGKVNVREVDRYIQSSCHQELKSG